MKKKERKKIDSFEMWCWRQMLTPWTKRGRKKKSVLEEIRPTCTLEVLMLKQKLSYFGHIMRAENESLEKSTMLGMV